MSGIPRTRIYTLSGFSISFVFHLPTSACYPSPYYDKAVYHEKQGIRIKQPLFLQCRRG